METLSYGLLKSIEERWEEVEILIRLAEATKAEEKLHSILCRSAVVLMIAQFEGFIKLCVKSVVEDANELARFVALPEEMKRTYCNQLLRFDGEKTNSKDLNVRVKKLISVLDKSNVEIDYRCFLVMNEYGNYQNNPKPDLIDKICISFGIENFFSLIDGSDFDVLFKNEKSESVNLIKNVETHLSEGLMSYPYELDFRIFNIQGVGAGKGKQRTFWQTFLDEIHRQRHAIAHGTPDLNEASVEDIRINKQKLLALQYVFMVVVCRFSVNVKVEEAV